MTIRAYFTALRRLLSEQMVMVYTMGKVGSTSVEGQLAHAYHTHTLYGNPPSPPFHIHKYGRLGYLLRRHTIYPLKRLMIRLRPQVKIVTFYRDPRDRNPSMFMHDLPFWLSSYINEYSVSTREEDSEFLLTAYKDIFPHDYPSIWVRDELARFTGIAVGELALGCDDYRIVKRGRYSVFIGRAESLDKCLVHLADFLDIPQLGQVPHTNRATGKWYAPIYDGFLQSLRADSLINYAEDFRARNGYTNAS